jgi:hypothetical protein
MGRLSRGCLRCRQRRVRCDELRPSCRRCVNRNEVCEGYRDEATDIFRYETARVIEHAKASQMPFLPGTGSFSPDSSRKRSKSFDGATNARGTSRVAGPNPVTGALTPAEAAGARLNPPLPWLRGVPTHLHVPVEEQATEQFLEKYVIYPCNQTSSPGFLEHLPCMFKEVNVEGRYALRWAIQAAAYADASKGQDGDALIRKALQCYGMALSALGDSLAVPGKVPDDYDLMTVVILDIFEVCARIQLMILLWLTW